MDQFTDNFAGQKLADLFPADVSRWTNKQIVGGSNTLALVSYGAPATTTTTTTITTSSTTTTRPPVTAPPVTVPPVPAGSGKALECIALPSIGSTVSKCCIERSGLSFKRGDHVWCLASFILDPAPSVGDLYLMDVEASLTSFGGRRVVVKDGGLINLDSKGAGAIQRSILGAPKFAAGKLNKILLHMLLAPDGNGLCEVWLNDVQVVKGYGNNMPSISAVYDNLQVGITANASAYRQRLLVVDRVYIGHTKP